MPSLQVVCRDVAYNLVPVLQRRSLHARLAEVLSAAAESSQVPASTVAYHWAQSCKSLSRGLADIEELPQVLKVVQISRPLSASMPNLATIKGSLAQRLFVEEYLQK